MEITKIKSLFTLDDHIIEEAKKINKIIFKSLFSVSNTMIEPIIEKLGKIDYLREEPARLKLTQLFLNLTTTIILSTALYSAGKVQLEKDNYYQNTQYLESEYNVNKKEMSVLVEELKKIDPKNIDIVKIEELTKNIAKLDSVKKLIESNKDLEDPAIANQIVKEVKALKGLKN